MRERRGQDAIGNLTSGPGKLTQALGIDRRLNGTDVTCGDLRGDLVVRRGSGKPFETLVTARIGISQCADWPLRFVMKGNRFVSGNRSPEA